MMAFARHLHTWFDRGVWSLKVKARFDKSRRNKVVFYWLPDGFNSKALFPDNVELDDEHFNSVRLIWAALEDANEDVDEDDTGGKVGPVMKGRKKPWMSTDSDSAADLPVLVPRGGRGRGRGSRGGRGGRGREGRGKVVSCR
ncbi:hypothetical protein FAUST_9246 [Fusarium austroamericanum]|uniref:Uncharacterized protein n=1 Tax=Fusarium austroamericanum TaxID=282268 RepID=A0AAN5Z4G8_FUSAU|nr:hypothetical protein FAUST_9246 [Fusarium austroamericanum]